ncbi:MAG: PQQ-dependent sugar dehydrogenase [Pseudoxanthomonas sp.]|nr:PQQ-dependent sugar dehydrogenase [Pseudoxanthomonas sp.]
MTRISLAAVCLAALLAGCREAPPTGDTATPPTPPAVEPATTPAAAATPAATLPFQVTAVGRFQAPWAMTFLPDGRLLVTEKAGVLRLFDPATGTTGTVAGTPEVDHGGQGGLGDVVLHPSFAGNGQVYLSYAEAGEDDTRGAAVARARLVLDGGDGRLEDLEVIWRQAPKTTGRGHYGHRLAFGPDGHLWITSGERQKFDPAQDMSGNLGKVLRLNDDGSPPADNPFADQGGVAAQVWSLGHRNPLGIDFDGEGRLWVHEMGPAHGDELNLVQRGGNYGYPLVSDGDHYDGTPIPDHATRPEFNAPAVVWVPAISPAGFVIYDGDLFADWRGSGLIGGLSSQALVRVEFDGERAREAERFDMGARIREVEQGPDGAVWLLEDEREGSGGRLLRLDPAAR